MMLSIGLVWVERVQAESESLPNIIFYFSDDLGYADLACYGHPYAKTPVLDKLASEGARFEQHYVTGVTCSPSRTGVMTGIHCARFENYPAYHGFGERTTITELLKKRGYQTAHFGKWHISARGSETHGIYGIDHVFTDKQAETEFGRDYTPVKHAIDYIKEHAGKKPLYINIWGHSTHYPVQANPDFASKFIEVKVKPQDFEKTIHHKFDLCKEIGADVDVSMRNYLGDVYSVDFNVGKVLKAIDEVGIRENTLFVYSSDHGPAPINTNKSDDELAGNMLGYAGVFRGGKHDKTEGGIRVPFIIRWPGKVEAGRVDSDSITSFIDWMPTLASIAGVQDLPEQMDGEDISDIWLGQTRERKTPLFWKTSSVNSPAAIRQGKWKYHEGGKRTEPALYDLRADPSESRNLAKEEPEVAAELQAKVDAWSAELPKSYNKERVKKKKNKKDEA